VAPNIAVEEQHEPRNITKARLVLRAVVVVACLLLGWLLIAWLV
jgi:Na+/glutamate symporter